MTDSATHFHVYRYQILPITQDVQLSLFDHQRLNIEDLRARKNEFFLEAVTSISEFTYARTSVIHKVLLADEDDIVMRFGANRSANITTRDFEELQLENWPTAVVVFNNDPSIQKVAVEVEYKAFRKTSTLISMLQLNLNRYLERYLLSVSFNPIFNKYQFWDVVAQYTGRIRETEFEMISPNMSNISRSLQFDLGALNRNTNTQKTNLRLQSDTDAGLTLSPNDEFINSLVNYSSEGGGNIALKIRGISRKITTNDSVTEAAVDEIEALIDSPEGIRELVKVFGNMFK